MWCPASRIRSTSAGWASAHAPTRKNVALTRPSERTASTSCRDPSGARAGRSGNSVSTVRHTAGIGRTIAARRPHNLLLAMECLVTGGAGFIGSHLVDALLDRGDTVSILDDLSHGNRENLASALELGAQLHVVDVRDSEAVERAFRSVQPEVVFHLAAQVDVNSSIGAPADDARTNVLGTIAVLAACRAAGVRRLINSSSGGAVYGDTSVLPTSEVELVKPLSPYGQSKFAAEGYCELYARLHDLSAVSLRYSNVYGPRQDASGEGGVVGIF